MNTDSYFAPVTRLPSLFAAGLLLCAGAISPSAQAELLYGVTNFRELISFDSASPSTVLTTVRVTNLSDQFESIAGLDFRPATGQLYVLGNAPGSQYRIYTLNLATGAATQVGASFSLSGATNFGFDFNPVADRIRLVSDADHNLRIDPVTGAVTTDTNLAYDGSDLNAGINGQVTGAAYTNNFAGATTTTLYGLEVADGNLVIQSPPNAGTLNTVATIDLALSGRVHFDISGATGTAFLTHSVVDPITFNDTTSLYQLDLVTAKASLIDEVGTNLGLRGVAVALQPVPEPGSVLFLGVGGLFLAAHRRFGR